MPVRLEKLESLLSRAGSVLQSVESQLADPVRDVARRWLGDAAAARFHFSARGSKGLLLLTVIGGTGTGKSTLVNRLLQHEVTATSFRRTYTSGAVAIAQASEDVPREWLGVEHVSVTPAQFPVRGASGSLVIAVLSHELTAHLVLVDTPDLDGDQPAHHTEADRAFRWAEAVLFLVTPEKYQMTELLPYYRLAARYGLPALFVMNKCEEQGAVDDYRRQLRQWTSDEDAGPGVQTTADESNAAAAPRVFAIPRNDAAYVPPPRENLDSLRAALAQSIPIDAERRDQGLRARSRDLLGRLGDQIVGPLRASQKRINELIVALEAMETPVAGIDVNPLTQQLQRRLQQRSVLYLMGPQRILDRVRQAPGLLVRLPRAAWEYIRSGNIDPATLNPSNGSGTREPPDFQSILGDQFAIVQSRIDDLVRGRTAGAPLQFDENSYAAAKFDPSEAGKIADEELGELRSWLEKRWNATPRDTRALQALLKYLPGGKKLTQWSEAAPYLLTLVVVTHHAFFGHVDLLVLGGYSLATWLSERLSNEVASHTRQTNQRIEDRFARLAHDQIARVCNWLRRQVPSEKHLRQLEEILAEREE